MVTLRLFFQERLATVCRHPCRRPLLTWLTALALGALFSGCERSPEPESPTSAAVTSVAPEGLSTATQHAWVTAVWMQQAAQPIIADLHTGLIDFATAPSDDSLQRARNHWHRAHSQLQRLQPLFILGAVNPQRFAALQQAHFQLDAWPIEPGYIDYLKVYPYSGIVNDFVIPLTDASLRTQHGLTSDTDVILGMHAIAYLLWGEHDQRPVEDFIPAQPNASQRQEGIQPEDLPGQRRAALLTVQAELLKQDMEVLGQQLALPSGSLLATYAKLPARAQLQLWQQGLLDLLSLRVEKELQHQLQLRPQPQFQRQSQKQFQRQPQKEPQTDDNVHQHSAAAGSHGQWMAAALAGVQELVLSHRDDSQPLAYWLNPSGDLSELATLLQGLQEALIEAETQWGDVSVERIEGLMDQLSQLQAWFGAANPEGDGEDAVKRGGPR